MDKIGSSYFECSILSEKSKISAQSHRFVGLGTGSILPKSAKLLLEQSSTSHSRIISDVFWCPELIRSAPIALQRWLANFLKISPFFVFCCIFGLIFAKSQFSILVIFGGVRSHFGSFLSALSVPRPSECD